MGFDVKQDSDLWSALGKVKIIEAKLNKDSFEMLLSDTYDFNKDSKNPLVIMGRRVQDANLLVPYFTIIKIKFKLKRSLKAPFFVYKFTSSIVYIVY